MNETRDFQRLLDEAGVKYFKAHEVLYLGGMNGYLRANAIPERNLWTNILPAIKAADEIRERIGRPITILSGYRNQRYNQLIGGASKSLHMEFKALDLTAKMSIPELARVAKQVRELGIFVGGVGIYNGFVHIDCRGKNTDWHG